MDSTTLSSLRKSTRQMFHHAYTSYLHHAFPEDELAPLSCEPLTRQSPETPEREIDVGLNDVLGNYSLTLVDSLSTLAILASATKQEAAGEAGRDADKEGQEGQDVGGAKWALREFQRGVKMLVELYGDGTRGPGGCGTRACGFDLDSKVQIFETNIRGLGGLLSAHLFAVGELPIRNYTPVWSENAGKDPIDTKRSIPGIIWPDNFTYTSQLLDLAHDLAKRLLPAFATETGIPYPRVNLRHGIPFYQDALDGTCLLNGTSTTPRDITETCTAGAGSLVLEFTVLSRLTGDERFEKLAKEAFWAIWNRRSSLDLLAGGIDAETGKWVMPPLSGIGAGVDSFFEYAFKAYILLSGDSDYAHGGEGKGEAEAFREVWEIAHQAIYRHIRRPSGLGQAGYPYYAQVDTVSGQHRYTWLDSLSAFYPGLLALAGEVEEATEAHLLYTALWERFDALPERWSVPFPPPSPNANASEQKLNVLDPGFAHWPLRPEFAESTHHLYLATRDPWFLHVGEMTLRDIWRRCWTPCGFAGLADVGSGRRRDRMESFFLGETVKYLFLLFESAASGNGGDGDAGGKATGEHPLGRWEGNWVFSTEGHPLIIPKHLRLKSPGHKATQRSNRSGRGAKQRTSESQHPPPPLPEPTCPAAPPPLPLTGSRVPNRPDYFHAAYLAQLHLLPADHNFARTAELLRRESSQFHVANDPDQDLDASMKSSANHSFYPWTLPPHLIPAQGHTAALPPQLPGPGGGMGIHILSFPDLAAVANANAEPTFAKSQTFPPLSRIAEGVLINSLSGLKFHMLNFEGEYRILNVGGVGVGVGESVFVSPAAVGELGLGGEEGWGPDSSEDDDEGNTGAGAEQHFRRVRDEEWINLVFDLKGIDGTEGQRVPVLVDEDIEKVDASASEAVRGMLDSLEGMVRNLLGLNDSGLILTDEDVDGRVGGTTTDPDLDTDADADLEDCLIDFFHEQDEPIGPQQLPVSPLRQAYHTIPAILPTGPGAVGIRSSSSLRMSHSHNHLRPSVEELPRHRIFFLDSTLCDHDLPLHIAEQYSVLVIRRGGCSFSEKLSRTVSLSTTHQPSGDADADAALGSKRRGLQLVIILSHPSDLAPGTLVRPLLDSKQGGAHRLAMCLVDGSEQTVGVLARAAQRFGSWDEEGRFVERSGDTEAAGDAGTAGGEGVGFEVRRRFWVESLGVRIANLVLL